MLYLGPGAVGIFALAAVIGRYVRQLDDEARAGLRLIMADLCDVGRDALNCFLHVIALYGFLVLVFTVPGSTALATSISVGAMRLFSSDDVHAGHYLRRTRQRFCEHRWWCKEPDD